MKTSYSLGNQRMMVAVVFMFLVISFQLAGCNGKKDDVGKKETPTTEQQTTLSTTATQVSVAITKIDDATPQAGQIPQVGHQVMIEGTISDPKAIICVLVHPLSGDTWWVQNLPSPPGKIDEHTWRWRTITYCGNETQGLNEDFEIVALSESLRTVCQLGTTIKMDEFPQDLPRSEIITVRRVRD